MFTLISDVGVELPHRAGTLGFGMSEHRAQWLVSTLGDVREEWVCIRARSAGTTWGFHAEYGDLTVSVSGGPPGVTEVGFARLGDARPATPGAVPVVYGGIDLFGYPVSEVEEALTGLCPGLTLDRPADTGRPAPYLVSVTLAARLFVMGADRK